MTAQDISTILNVPGVNYFYDQEKDACFVVNTSDESQRCYCHELKTSQTDALIQRLHIKEFGKLLPETKLKQFNQMLEFGIREKGVFDTARTRVYKKGSKIFVDLGDGLFAVIKADKVILTHKVPVKFLHNSGMGVKVTPDLDNGDIALLHKYLRVRDEQFKLILTFIFNCFFTDTHYLMLLLLGPAGSGKSFIQKVIKTVVDPNVVMLRNQTGKVEDLVLAGAHSHLPDFNNLSKLSSGIQDALCTMLTGGCATTRTKYTNKGQSAIHTHNPVLANGIGNIVSREDLYERTVTIQLRKIEGSKTEIIPESELWADFLADLPVIMGGIFNALSDILFQFKTFDRPSHLTRMADFHLLGLVTEIALGWQEGSFEEAYRNNITIGHDDVLIDSSVAQALIKWKELGNSEIAGTYDQIKSSLNRYVGLGGVTPRALSAELDRLSGALQNIHGIKIKKLARSSAGSRIKIICG